ncbi:MAG TPA: hypothetical protein VNC84_07920 [Gammaproteobacteria bacterium]|nr:hypothetical protein [Gammaproteobacteria bacterium]
MKKIITRVIVTGLLSALCGSAFAASAGCSAQNKSTGQFFTATGIGETQVAASQDGQNTVMQICKQNSSNTPDACVPNGCTSSQ